MSDTAEQLDQEIAAGSTESDGAAEAEQAIKKVSIV